VAATLTVRRRPFDRRAESRRKAVAGKEEPFTLVAEDKSRCRVPEQQFRETSLGELVWCAWVR